MYYIYDKFGYSLKRTSDQQAQQGRHVESDELQPGDVLCFYTSGSYIGHVGIYIGDRNYIHAMGSAYGVVETSLDDPWLTRKFEARRMLGCRDLKKENSADPGTLSEASVPD